MSDQRFGIVLTSKLRHAALWEAAKQLGSAAALASRLGIHQSRIGKWINLQEAPSYWWLEETDAGKAAVGQLLVLCNSTPEDLWPTELRAAIKGGEVGKRIERRQDVVLAKLAYQAEQRLCLPSPDEVLERQESSEKLSAILKKLPSRLRLALSLKYGLDGNEPHTFDGVGKALNVCAARAQQLVRKAENELRLHGAEVVAEEFGIV